MRLLFLNQYGPPDPVPTARLLGELAGHLRARGHEVEILSPTQTYLGRPTRGGSRLRREVAALFAILKTGWSRKRARPDAVLALSSPPGLLVVAAVLAWRHRAPLAHWAMDLYPELALSLGETGPNAVYRGVKRAMRWAYRRCALVVALDEDMRAHLQKTYGLREVRILEPWPSATPAPEAAVATEPETPWTWLYSGNLGRAHEWRTLLDAQRLLEARGAPVRLLFQGDGAARPAAMEYAGRIGLARCDWKGYVAEQNLSASLTHARVLIATQRPETRGLLWPSKLALLERLPRPILFVGPADGAIAHRLRGRPANGVFAPGQSIEIADWVEQCHRYPVSDPDPLSPPASSGQQEGCGQLELWLGQIVPPSKRENSG